MASRLTRLCLRLLRRPAAANLFSPSRTLTSATTERPRPHRQYGPRRPHEHTKASELVGSWKNFSPRCDPREAQKRLDMLRRDYARQVRECRKQYILEMELQRQQRLRREETRREASRLSKEQRKAAKKEADEARATRHRAFQEELRQTLLKERAERVENWRAKAASREAKKNEKREHLCRQSSIWIDEADLERKIRNAVIETYHL